MFRCVPASYFCNINQLNQPDMKTNILKLSCLLLFVLTFISCTEDCSEFESKLNKTEAQLEETQWVVERMSAYVNKIFENESGTRELARQEKTMCDFGKDDAIVEKESWYVTKLGSVKGKAYLKIPIPKGHSISKTSLRDNVVIFEVRGDVYSKEFEYSGQYVTGLKEDYASELKIEVNYYFEKDECGSDVTILNRKHKGSILTGQPFRSEKRVNN